MLDGDCPTPSGFTVQAHFSSYFPTAPVELGTQDCLMTTVHFALVLALVMSISSSRSHFHGLVSGPSYANEMLISGRLGSCKRCGQQSVFGF